MKKMKYVLLSTLLLSASLFTSCNKAEMIMIVGVKSSESFDEIGILVSALDYRNQEEIDGINFYTGKISGKNVVIAQTPVGTSEAAMTTTIGIKQYHPKYVISEGSSGGHHTQAEVHDIILGKDILDIASYEGDISDPEHGGKDGGHITLQHPTLHSDTTLLETASKVEYKVEDINPDVTQGIIASSDCWNKGVNFVNSLHNVFQEDCEEMESYAVANVCKNYNIPMLAIRVISNNLILGSGAGEPGEFDPKAKENCQHYVLDVVKAI